MSYDNWTPLQGEEVQVKFPCGLVEIGKFIEETDELNCVCKIGRRRHTIPKLNVSQNTPPYKKVKQEKDVVKTPKSRQNEDDEYDDKWQEELWEYHR